MHARTRILHAIFCLHVHASIWAKCMHAKGRKLHVNICLHVYAHNLHSFCLQFTCILLAYIKAICMHCFRIALFVLIFSFTNTDINMCMFMSS